MVCKTVRLFTSLQVHAQSSGSSDHITLLTSMISAHTAQCSPKSSRSLNRQVNLGVAGYKLDLKNLATTLLDLLLFSKPAIVGDVLGEIRGGEISILLCASCAGLLCGVHNSDLEVLGIIVLPVHGHGVLVCGAGDGALCMASEERGRSDLSSYEGVDEGHFCLLGWKGGFESSLVNCKRKSAR